MPVVGSLFSLLAAIVAVGALTVFLSSTNTANILKSLFDGLTGSLKAAMGH